MSVQFAGNMRHGYGVQGNEHIRERREAERNFNQSKQLKNGSIHMNLGGQTDSILMRKQLARKRAMKVISDAWATDKKIDNGIEERKAHVQELKAEQEVNRQFIEECNTTKAELKESYGIEDDSQEQKDLELLQKRERLKSDPYSSLTAEEEERLKELDKQPLTDYQQQCLDIDEAIGVYQAKIDSAEEAIIGENMAVRDVGLERLKTHGMIDAQNEADAINEAASKEVIGMLMSEAREYVDEKRKEEQEAAKEKAEEKEEQEEKLEEQKLEREKAETELELQRTEGAQQEEVRKEARENAREQSELLEEAGEHVIDPVSGTSQAQQEIKDILQKMKLLEEDLKGAKVDNTI
ncbi:MAG: hypothetical protein NC318_12925 [Blautia sp.]|nr:hypothetical protein [Blautia sp.]